MKILLASLLLLGFGSSASAQKTPFDIHALLKVKRISEPQLSPDGKTVAFTVGEVDLEKNRQARQIYLVSTEGSVPRQVTSDGQNTRPRWSPDGKQIAFLSSRNGTQQIWIMDAEGGKQQPLTTLPTEADNHVWSPDGKNIVFISEVWTDCPDQACNEARLKAEKDKKTQARIYTSLLYRHWNQFQGPRRKHLMVVPASGGVPKDLTPGIKFDVPPFSLGGGEDFAISPDGKELAYVANLDEDQALSTNSDIFTVGIEGGESRKISTSEGADVTPQYSPDGKYLTWRSQERAGFESDRWRLLLLPRDGLMPTVVTETIDRPVTGFTWHPDSQRIAFTIEDRGLQVAQLMPVAGGGARMLTQGAAHVDDLQFSADGKMLLYTEASGSSPSEIYVVKSGDRPKPLTRLNATLLAGYQLTPMETFSAAGSDGASIQSFLIKPPNFDPTRKYPAILLVHGGPQGAWGESWSYRWNPQVFAAAGFVVALANPRGSTGYGQKFTDEVSGDWGGKAFEDLMAVTDKLAGMPFVDPDRMAAAGGSYGGYMVNWFLGHTTRFKALVSHAGVYDLQSMAGETEELWFTKWEFKGMPWENREMYEKWSPSNFVENFKTPTLVVHGELDYRVPVGQGMQLFTALQLKKVPSKLVLFPDEGHWILKPHNSILWYDQVLGWIKEWTTPKQATQ